MGDSRFRVAKEDDELEYLTVLKVSKCSKSDRDMSVRHRRQFERALILFIQDGTT